MYSINAMSRHLYSSEMRIFSISICCYVVKTHTKMTGTNSNVCNTILIIFIIIISFYLCVNDGGISATCTTHCHRRYLTHYMASKTTVPKFIPHKKKENQMKKGLNRKQIVIDIVIVHRPRIFIVLRQIKMIPSTH